MIRPFAETNLVEDEELRFRTKIHGITQADLLDVRLGFLGDIARIAAVGLVGDGVDNVTDEGEGRLLEERVDARRAGVRNKDHVGLVDGLPATDGASVEAKSLGETFFRDPVDRHGGVLPLAQEIHEFVVHELESAFLDQFQYLGW